MKQLLYALSSLVLAFGSSAFAQEEPATSQDLRKSLGIELGPSTGTMKKIAEIDVPEGYQFTGQEGTGTILQIMDNIVDGSELGFLSPADYFDTEAESWFLVFEFNEVGYVKDDEKEDLDADAMYKQIKEFEPQVNAERQRLGIGTMHLRRFVIEPNYNAQTNNLEWALEFLSKPEETLIVNHNIKILGRKGYMQVTLVCSPEILESILPEARRVLSGFRFKKGQTYAEYRKGDKIAEYGLTGLVVGGGLALAAKSGLLGRLLKPLLVGAVAVGAFFKRLFTGKSD